MKKFNLFLMCGIFVTAFIATGCDEPSDVGGSFISLDVSLLEFDSEGGSLTATVSSDGDWIITGVAEWITVSAESGEGNATVTVTAAENEFFTSRASVLTFRTGERAAELVASQETRILQDTIDGVHVGVVINGVRWATRNVLLTTAAGVSNFVASPEISGSFHQWNRRRGYPAADPATGGINWIGSADSISSNVWETVTDPCPIGWRVPTIDEMESLLDTRTVWTTFNGINGKVFTDKATGDAIFLPAAGWRNRIRGVLSNVGMYGLYWSTPTDEDTPPRHLFFTSEGAKMFGSDQLDALSVRCVAE